MRVCIITAGAVTNVIELPESFAIDPDRKAIRGPASYTVETPDGEDLVEYEAVFEADDGTLYVASEDAGSDWSWTAAGGFIAPAPIAPTQAELAAYAARRRLQYEQGGAIWNGWPIHTDDRSINKYLSELQAIALNDRIDGDPWKFADGVFRPVSNAEFPQLTIAARAHVRQAFGIEGVVLAQIAAGTITTTAEIDAAFA